MESLPALPPSFAATRVALHRVATRLVAPARKPHNEIALMPTSGGFGTPAFEFDGQRTRVRVEGTELVLESDGSERRTELESLAAGGELLGPALLPDGVPDDETPLEIDPDAAAALAAWNAFSAALLGRFGEGLPKRADPTPITLWPEHFDVALEAGSESAGQRATYGASPGDTEHAEPYLYVSLWKSRDGALWNATAFSGAELSYSGLSGADDPAPLAFEFLETRRSAIAS
jgi:hypothetical protein